MQILNQLTISENNILVNSDTESLFFSVPILNMLEIIWQHITSAGLPQNLSDPAECCVSCTRFIHLGKIYWQVQGATTRSPLSSVSPAPANAFMTASEKEAISSSPMKQKYWHRYMDGTSAICPRGPYALKRCPWSSDAQAPQQTVFLEIWKGSSTTLSGCSGQPTSKPVTVVWLQKIHSLTHSPTHPSMCTLSGSRIICT
jgi:hypothetical protein